MMYRFDSFALHTGAPWEQVTQEDGQVGIGCCGALMRLLQAPSLVSDAALAGGAGL
jgi:hypothetical protein